MTKKTAEKAAEAINKYWEARGYKVLAHVEHEKHDDRGPLWAIKSRLIDGLPPEMKK